MLLNQILNCNNDLTFKKMKKCNFGMKINLK